MVTISAKADTAGPSQQAALCGCARAAAVQDRRGRRAVRQAGHDDVAHIQLEVRARRCVALRARTACTEVALCRLACADELQQLIKTQWHAIQISG
jgi:hypothetical protein